MDLPGFTVVLTDERRYSANHLAIGVADGDLHATITFECSGRMYTFGCSEVTAIEYWPSGRQYCNSCDQPLPPLPPTP